MGSLRAILVFLLLIRFIDSFPQNCSNTSTGRPPVNDLGAGYWHGAQGGLYPNGSNVRPAAHNSGGLMMASQVRPLDTNGVYDPVNGKVVWLSIGMSNTTQETQSFIPLVDTFWNKNLKLVLVDGAQGGQHINIIIDSTANFWNVIVSRLKQRGLSAKQVQAVWFKEAEANPSDTSFPNYAVGLKNKFKTVMKIIKNKYPNIKLCYLSSRIYAGYANGVSTLNPEPYAYYSGWSVKWLIEDQINGDTNLIYSGTNPKSPWLSWGPYPWADGLVPRSDGLTWVCPGDYQPDGTHPSLQGRQKVAAMLFQFFTADQTSVPWFLQNPASVINLSSAPSAFYLRQNYPNPFNPETIISYELRMTSYVKLEVFDVKGRKVTNLIDTKQSAGHYKVEFNGNELSSGVYFYKLSAIPTDGPGRIFSETKKSLLIK